MAVSEFHANILLDEEKDLISDPGRWFYKLIGQKTKSFEEILARKCIPSKGGGKRHPTLFRKVKSKAQKDSDYRFPMLAKSLLREDKKRPPLCIFCLDDDPDISKTCGRLQWCPELPLFFAVHELCTLMVPEITTVDNPTPLGNELFRTDARQINEAFLRGRQLRCTACKEKGALIGCCCEKCRVVFHLPCAIRSMCYIDYENFRCFCPRHSASAFSMMKNSFLSLPLRTAIQTNFDCCICMDRTEGEAVMHSVVQTDCCGVQFYHFDCIKNATLIRGAEMRCPKCNRPNDQTGFEEKIGRQGIYFQTYKLFDEPDEDDSISGNYRSRCYYAMTGSSARGRSCLSSLGPDTYDDSDALNDGVFNPLEALNACISCGIHCHRICAGEPWSCYNPDEEGEEEKWQCEDCRETSSATVVSNALSRSSTARSTNTPNEGYITNEKGRYGKKRCIHRQTLSCRPLNKKPVLKTRTSVRKRH